MLWTIVNLNHESYVMGDILRFPRTKNSKAKRKPKLHSDSQQCLPSDEYQSILGTLLENKDFTEMIAEWPCFDGLMKTLSLNQIQEKYFEDDLTLAQDFALEYMLHMYDPRSHFNLGNAFYAWSKEDRDYFLLSLTVHAEMIEDLQEENR